MNKLSPQEIEEIHNDNYVMDDMGNWIGENADETVEKLLSHIESQDKEIGKLQASAPRLLQSYKELRANTIKVGFDCLEEVTHLQKELNNKNLLIDVIEEVKNEQRRKLLQKDQEIEKLRKALEVYAKEENYIQFIDDPKIGIRIICDQGKIAREALK